MDRAAIRTGHGSAAAGRPFGHQCEGDIRFLLPEPVRALARARWPEARPKPNVRSPMRSRTARKIRSDHPSDPLHSRKELQRALASSLATRSGGGLVSSNRGYHFPAAHYPAKEEFSTHNWPQDPTLWPEHPRREKRDGGVRSRLSGRPHARIWLLRGAGEGSPTSCGQASWNL